MNNYYIYVGDNGGFFKKGEKYYLASSNRQNPVCVEDEEGIEYFPSSKYFNDNFKKLETIREEKIKVILDE